LFAAINTIVVTYFLAIERIPTLKEVFPSFLLYFVFVTGIGIPVLIGAGYLHFKKSGAFSSETDIAIESNPYSYKLPPGFWKDVFAPSYLVMIQLLLKIQKNEKLTDDEIKKIEDIQKNLDILIKGGSIGNPKVKHSYFDSTEKDNQIN
jgi:hypothetical protein